MQPMHIDESFNMLMMVYTIMAVCLVSCMAMIAICIKDKIRQRRDRHGHL